MPKLPNNISASQAIKVLGKVGYLFNRQKGSHIILVNEETHRIAVVPNRKDLPRGTLRAIISQSGLTIDEFLRLLE
jgi:predicted RNA binding protein YcfA (HicA-like mRNA interferase family)